MAHCRPNQEIKLAERLALADVPHWLPLVRHERRAPSGKRRVTDRAMFAGYLFLAGDEFDRLNALSCGPIVGTIPVFDVAGLVRDLRQVCAVIRAGEPIGAEQAPRPGDAVRVASGPWEGTTGTVAREAGRHLLLVHVRALGRVLPLEIEPWRLERAGGDGR